MGDAAWKTREDAVLEVGQIVTEVKRIQPSVGGLLDALKARLGDSNRNLAAVAAKVIGQVATAMGPPFEKQVKGLLPTLLKVLSDNKPQVRTALTEALDASAPETGLESLLPHIGEALKPEGPILRKDLLTWLSFRFKADSKVTKEGVAQLLRPVIQCLNDRSGDVRKAAQVSFPPIVAVLGYDYVKKQCADDSLKTQVATVYPLLEKCREEGVGVPQTPKSAATAAPVASSTGSASGSGVAAQPKAQSVATSASSAAAAKKSKGDPEAVPPFAAADFKAKDLRAKKDERVRWQFETPTKEFSDLLLDQMDAHISGEIKGLLFNADFKKQLQGIAVIDETLTDATISPTRYGVEAEDWNQRVQSVTDLLLKYTTLRLCDTNTTLHLKCFELIQHLLTALEHTNYHISEYEASVFLPTFLTKTGDNKESVRVIVRAILKQFCSIYPVSKMFGHLLGGLNSKNSRTRAECLEEMATLIQRHGMGIFAPAKVFPLVAKQIADRENSVRSAAINVVVQSYFILGDAETLYKHLGQIPPKDKSLLDEKLKRAKLSGPVSTTSSEPAADSNPEVCIPSLLLRKVLHTHKSFFFFFLLLRQERQLPPAHMPLLLRLLMTKFRRSLPWILRIRTEPLLPRLLSVPKLLLFPQ